MKKQFLLIALLASSLHFAAKGQQQDVEHSYVKQPLSKMEVEALVGYYTQDGNNSAVTGGRGTEELSVFSIQTSGKYTHKARHQFSYNLGVDVITSASTDNIDFVPSSVSYKDQHVYASLGYGIQASDRWQFSGNVGFGFESDYLSIPLGVSVLYEPSSRMYSIAASINASFDDLRWWRSRFGEVTDKSLELVYPQELRGVESHDVYRRNTLHVKTAYSQTINERLLVGVSPELVYQQGLLSTPFHRVYFTDGSVHLERLPTTRIQFPIAFWANAFIGGSHILKARYQFYADSWSIASHSFQAGYTKRLNAQWAFLALVRYYTQEGTSYFKPIQQHEGTAAYHTSDYDLSTMQSYKASLGILYNTLHSKVQKVGLRYAYYATSNKLAAHILTLSIELGFSKK